LKFVGSLRLSKTFGFGFKVVPKQSHRMFIACGVFAKNISRKVSHQIIAGFEIPSDRPAKQLVWILLSYLFLKHDRTAWNKGFS
jgi:hypothetical protein